MKMNEQTNAILAQYDENSKKTGGNSKKYDLKNYFSTYLPDGVSAATKRIRILPNNDGVSPFVEVYGHKTQLDGQYKTFACLRHNFDKDCPYCEAREALIATGKESDKELSKAYGSRKMYVVKVIDRDKEMEGVKFWRFNHDYRSTGIFDKIVSLIRAKDLNVIDPDNGCDLIITVSRDQNNRPIIQGIVDGNPSPITDDATLREQWLSDDRTWEDVYSVKSYEYLQIAVRGEVPYWNKDKDMWVTKDSMEQEESDNLEEELTLGSTTPVTEVDTTTTETTTTESTESTVEDDEDDDMPF